jgi:hypothetical protein
MDEAKRGKKNSGEVKAKEEEEITVENNDRGRKVSPHFPH